MSGPVHSSPVTTEPTLTVRVTTPAPCTTVHLVHLVHWWRELTNGSWRMTLIKTQRGCSLWNSETAWSVQLISLHATVQGCRQQSRSRIDAAVSAKLLVQTVSGEDVYRRMKGHKGEIIISSRLNSSASLHFCSTNRRHLLAVGKLRVADCGQTHTRDEIRQLILYTPSQSDLSTPSCPSPHAQLPSRLLAWSSPPTLSVCCDP